MRLWDNTQSDDGSTHCLGNGKLAVYEEGPDIIQVFGPPYSSPSYMKLVLSMDAELVVRSEREAGTAVWRHAVEKNGSRIGEMIDFVDSQLPCMVRNLKLSQSLDFELALEAQWEAVDNRGRYAAANIKLGLLVSADAGISVYQHKCYPSPTEITHQVIALGAVEASFDLCKKVWIIHCSAGESTLLFTGGSSYPACIMNSEEALDTGYEKMLVHTREWWKVFTVRRMDFSKLLPSNLPKRELLLKTIDEVSVLIKTQQGIEGGVLAGHNYHLGYIRDQYGVSRCLLKLGYFEEAKSILSFYWNIWKRHGVLRNAQAIGVDGIFHIHENDEVEITGYLIIQTFDYLEKSGNFEFVNEILPMLEWAWNAQKRHLKEFMLPFNGDETYIAGGVLPRNTLNDGSAEATLLFVTAGEKLLGWLEKYKLWDENKLAENKSILECTKQSYGENFFMDGELLTNNPERTADMQLPRFRHGVCERCNKFGWTEMNAYNRYLCPACFSRDDMHEAEKIVYRLQSVSLMPMYIGSSLIPRNEISGMTESIIRLYKESGSFPSRPEGNTTVGYDYGLLLYNLVEQGNILAEEMFQKMLSVLDATGVWVEYYEDGRSKGTRCRPWESGINLEAAIHFAIKMGK